LLFLCNGLNYRKKIWQDNAKATLNPSALENLELRIQSRSLNPFTFYISREA